ncbi:FUSC family protein [Rugosimonospora africana]|uniref:Integral membrane bound transporter domain-containing protein n=1 Tax=Rugosimonospora africana TaxID=556532 RepID=A0A8J3QS07_9ACTN|nr:FUSC family protein [Rugosimonospora africana]GIH15589.1 hypothetical protein Raf01_37610 [Rugosimonospora africana]
MIGVGVLDRLRHRDPEYRSSLRALRLTLATVPAFYVCLYVVHDAIMATYLVFGVIAAGLFFRLPGSPRRRAAILLTVLPATWVLITAGTLLDRSVWGSVAVTLVVGFLVAFSGVGGPRLLGLANGLQLFYIVANFPPHHAHATASRLIGATLGVLLTAAAEVLLWPDPTPVSYPRRLAEAADALADLLDTCADRMAGRSVTDEDVARRQERAEQTIESTQMLGFARTERPTSSGHRDRALRDGAATTRELAEHVRRLVVLRQVREGSHPDLEGSLRDSAHAMRTAARILRDGTTPPGAGAAPTAPVPGVDPGWPPDRPAPDRERLRLLVDLWSIAEHVRIFEIAARVGVGEPVDFGGGRPPGFGTFWYLRHSQLTLFARQLWLHLTPASVYFQGALRLAVALAAARLAAAELNLSHGFWALLGTLTVMRTSAISTRATLVTAFGGTLIGAIVTALLLRFAHGPIPYAVEFVVATLLSYALGAVLGLAWAQATLTIMITLVFAQLAPADWSLAEVRLLDVLLGAAVGMFAGLVMWPRGAAGEVRRRVGSFLTVTGSLIEQTTATLVGDDRPRPPDVLSVARRERNLADASLCEYYLERPDPRMAQVHWDAALVVGEHVVHGAEILVYDVAPGSLASWPDAASVMTDVAHQLSDRYRDLAGQLPSGRICRPVALALDRAAIGERVTAMLRQTGERPEDARLIETAVWLANLSDNLEWIQIVSGRPPRPARPR